MDMPRAMRRVQRAYCGISACRFKNVAKSILMKVLWTLIGMKLRCHCWTSNQHSQSWSSNLIERNGVKSSCDQWASNRFSQLVLQLGINALKLCCDWWTSILLSVQYCILYLIPISYRGRIQHRHDACPSDSDPPKKKPHGASCPFF
jgi:hypothetical protein